MLSYLCEIEYAHIHVNAFGGQKGILGPLVLELTSSSESSNMGAGSQTLVPLKNKQQAPLTTEIALQLLLTSYTCMFHICMKIFLILHACLACKYVVNYLVVTV